MHRLDRHSRLTLFLTTLVSALLLGAAVLATTVGAYPHTASGASSPMAPGDLDPIFGTGGVVTTTVGTDVGVSGLLLRSNGTILQGGTAFDTGVGDMLVVGYLSTGALDPGWGSGGRVTTDFNGGYDGVAALAQQSDGKVVAGGTAAVGASFTPTTTFALVRYLANGSLDPAFGVGGKVTTHFGADTSDLIRDIALQGDGKIVAVGISTLLSTSRYDWALARYLPNGSLDPTFGSGGVVTTTIRDFGYTDESLALQPDGKLLVAGMSDPGGDFIVARFNANGTLDPTFGTGGLTTTDFQGLSDEANAITLQTDGKIVLAGDVVVNGHTQFGLARYNPNGSLDPGFGVGGTVVTSSSPGSSRDEGYGVRQDAQGRLIVGGYFTRNGTNTYDFGLIRYYANGTVDLTFGTNGRVRTAFGTDDARGSDLLIQPDGKLLLGGRVYNPNQSTSYLALARYEGGGTLNTATPSGTSTATRTPTATATPTCGPIGTIITSPNGPNGLDNTLQAVTALAPDNLWAVGETVPATGSRSNTLILHGDGAGWTVVPSPNGSATASNFLTAITAVAANDIWAVGYTYSPSSGTTQPLTEHWDGTAWTLVPSATTGNNPELHGVVALASNDVWAVGHGSLIEHWDGTAWSLVPVPALNLVYLYGITAITPDDLWAVGYYSPGSNTELPLTLHWDGTAWTQFVTPAPGSYNELFAVAARTANDIWAVGAYTTSGGYLSQTLTLHWNGSAWSQIPSPSTGDAKNPLKSVVVAGPYVWAVGDAANGYDQGTTLVLRWNGSGWARLLSPNPGPDYNQLNGVVALPGLTVWAVGRHGDLNGTFTLTERFTDGCPTPTATRTPTATVTGTPPTATPTATTCPVQFTDVPSGSTFYDFVRCLACRGIVGGYPCGGPNEPCPGLYFRPNTNVTRGQVSKIISESAQFSDAVPSSQQTFEDVASGSTFHLWVERLSTRGIIGGYPCGGPFEPCVSPTNRPYFRPNNNVTRGQLAKIIAGAAQYTETPTDQTFEDVVPASTFYLYIERLASRGIIGGYPCGGVGEPCVAPANHPYFRPNNTATRGQMSKIAAVAFFPNCVTPHRRR